MIWSAKQAFWPALSPTSAGARAQLAS